MSWNAYKRSKSFKLRFNPYFVKRNISGDQFSEYLKYSLNDVRCKEMWDKYKNGAIDFPEVEQYEKALFRQMVRENKLNFLLK